MTALTIPSPSRDEAALARSATTAFLAREQSLKLASESSDTLSIRFVDDSAVIELPAKAAELLMTILEHMASGHAFSLVPMEAELTTQQAAELLSVSRPYLIKLLDEESIPYRKVGRHRRIRVSDILEFQNRNQVDRAEALDNLVSISEEMGDYD